MVSSKGIRVATKLVSQIGIAIFAIFSSFSAYALPTFSKSFSPNTIGVGAVSTLTFTITNDATPATSAAFIDNLPAGVEIAAAPNITNNCDGSVSAPPGGSSISLTGGRIAPNQSCMVSVDVTSSVVGTHTNVSGDLTSSAGNSGNATADLMVVSDRPGFSKAFAPASVSLGDRSTLTFTVDNSSNADAITNIAFVDNFPTGIEIADPSNVMNSCGGALTANPGSTSLTLAAFGGVPVVTPAGGSCVVSLDVVTTGVGVLVNTTGNLTSTTLFNQPRDSGFAIAELAVDVSSLQLIKNFLDDPVTPGGTVNLNFSITNRDRRNPVSNIAFTDDLDSILTGLVATGLPQSNVCGSGSSLAGTGVISFSGGQLAAGESCDFTVALQVPAGAASGGYTNLTSAITADGVVGNMASDTLFVDVGPVLSKTFVTNPVGGGDTVTMEFTIVNGSASAAASDIAFLDNTSTFISGSLPSGLPQSDVCGVGSTLSQAFINTEEFGIQLTGGSLAGGESCTFTADLTTPVGTPGGVYTNITDAISATIGGSVSMGNQAEASLTVIEAPELNKEFLDDPAAPGGTTTLQFVISNPESAPTAATDIAFTDDLDATLSGLIAAGLPANDVCGTGSVLTGTSTISLTGGRLAIGEECVFNVLLAVPASALPGSYDNETSDLTATLGGISSSGLGGADTLIVAGLDVSKTFSESSVLPGATVGLEFTVTNTSTSLPATNILFTDDLGDFLPGTTIASGVPATDVCGTGSSLSLSGSDFLIFQGGSLGANSSCVFSVDLLIPANADVGRYPNTTSQPQADFSGETIFLNPARAELEIDNVFLDLSKAFAGDAVSLGTSSSIEFTVTNLSESESVADIAFSDDLDAVLSGMNATGLPQSNVCGAGSSLSGSGVISLSGGSLAAGASCTFAVGIDLPTNAEGVGSITNTTSSATGTVNGLDVVGEPAVDSAIVVNVDFSKMFSNPNIAGDMGSLTFAIHNNGTQTLDRLLFTDDLEAVLSGLVATGLPAADVCGVGSLLTGTSVLTLTGGVLNAGETCQFSVDISIPSEAEGGSYENVTSPLNDEPIDIAPPAEATLEIIVREASLSKSFDTAADPGDTVGLSFEIQNTGSADLNDLAFSDDLDSVLTGLVATGLPTSDVCGTGSLLSGDSTIALTGANLAAGDSCQFTVQIDVPTNAEAGDYTNTTSDLTELGDALAEAATDDLTVNALPSANFSKAFGAAVDPGASTNLSFTIVNTGNVALSSLNFSDNLDNVLSGLSASGLPVNDICGPGSSITGSGTIALSGGNLAIGASCQFSVQVDVPSSSTAGTYTNVTSALNEGATSVSGAATADLLVNQLITSADFSKSFAAAVDPGNSTNLNFEISNTGDVDLTQLSFSDDLDAVLSGLVASGLPANDICGVGSTLSGTSIITLTGGNLTSGTSCQFSVQVNIPTGSSAGDYVNTTSTLDENSVQLAAPAVATLTVNQDDGMVTICHKPGTRAEKTLTLPQAALNGHLRHGDTIGACEGSNANNSAAKNSKNYNAAAFAGPMFYVHSFFNPYKKWSLFGNRSLFSKKSIFDKSEDKKEAKKAKKKNRKNKK